MRLSRPWLVPFVLFSSLTAVGCTGDEAVPEGPAPAPAAPANPNSSEAKALNKGGSKEAGSAKMPLAP